MSSALSIIISREYLERVKRKSFIISTILMPILMVGMMVAPALIAMFSEPETQTIAVIDDTGVIAPMLQNDGSLTFKPFGAGIDAAKADEDYDAILVIGREAVSEPKGNITLYTRGAPSMQNESAIRSQLGDAIESIRIDRIDISNLRQIMDQVHADVSIDTFRIDREEETATSSTLSYLLGITTMFILYMFIILYGQMVMTSIIEEKNNRVLELVVSSVRPTAHARDIRLPGSLPHRRLSVLLVDLRSHRLGGRQYTGRLAAPVGSHPPHHHRAHTVNDRPHRPQLHAGHVDVYDTLHIAHGDDGASAIRHTGMAAGREPAHTGCEPAGNDMAQRQNLPRGHIHVRQETYRNRTHPMDPLQMTGDRAGWTVLRTYSDPQAAYIDRGLLEANDIPAELTGTVMASVYPMTDTWAPVRLIVPASMAARAAELLAE